MADKQLALDTARSLQDPSGLLVGLDDEQREAVTTEARPLCILAGAGAGKTRVLTRRIAYRAALGTLDPRHTLALTFTNRAARELRTRLGAMGDRDLPTTGTFHAIAYAQLRSWWAASNRPEPALLDRKTRMVSKLLPARFELRAAVVAAEIDWAQARGITPEQFAPAANQAGRQARVGHDRIAEIYRAYVDEKRHRRVVDFDDLLVLGARVMGEDPDFAASQRWRFRHIFVDEYQDVNQLQHDLLTAWLGDRDDLCVVGDPNQSIYRWNGADARYLLDFKADHPDAAVVQLGTNHRSCPHVVRLADTVLACAPDGTPGVVTHRPTRRQDTVARLPTVTACRDDQDEVVTVARAVRAARTPGAPWRRQAVLVRTNAQATAIAEALERVGIPSRVKGGDRFLDHPTVRDALRTAGRASVPLRQWVADLEDSLNTAATDARAGVTVDPELGDKIDALGTLVDNAKRLLQEQPQAPAAALPGWLTATLRNEDIDRDRSDAVDVVSFHAAKGLEWPIVHLAGIEEGYVPSGLARRAGELAEEQRLLYVAITRAELELHVTWARQRTFGARVSTRQPSRWLRAIEDDIAAQAPSVHRAQPAVVNDSMEAARRELVQPGTDSSSTLTRAERIRSELLGWRTATARAASVPDEVVLPTIVLERVVAAPPTSTDDMEAIPGLGIVKARSYGPALLAAIARGADSPTTEVTP